jgi:hypothetical protein
LPYGFSDRLAFPSQTSDALKALPVHLDGMPMRTAGTHLGPNAVDAAHYLGWEGALAACEDDAQDMAAAARGNQFEITLLLTWEATSRRLLELLAREASIMGLGQHQANGSCPAVFQTSGSGHSAHSREATVEAEPLQRYVQQSW